MRFRPAALQKNVREKGLKLFSDLSGRAAPSKPEDTHSGAGLHDLGTKRSLKIGFLLFMSFLVIDLVVALVLMSMGMMMLPYFVLVGG